MCLRAHYEKHEDTNDISMRIDRSYNYSAQVSKHVPTHVIAQYLHVLLTMCFCFVFQSIPTSSPCAKALYNYEAGEQG